MPIPFPEACCPEARGKLSYDQHSREPCLVHDEWPRPVLLVPIGSEPMRLERAVLILDFTSRN